ncbi:N-acetyltransferase 10 [Batrachochytrium dendrobatidis]|nr:N-acetyltransferase 10 [Batrachochytrium dendrobatidis]KAK5671843.1 N-acetyltransferase 10 [Batrachochytrium dendrobatidis]
MAGETTDDAGKSTLKTSSSKNSQRKKLDSRIPSLISNGVQTNHRSFFVLVGDKGRDQVVTLYYLLSKARVASRPSVLWCYKKELGFSSNRKKRMGQIKKQIARGARDPDEDDPFELFVSSTSIRYAYYKETEKILGNTFGMCVLQDFEALTPNLLARTIETVEGGGIVVLLLKTMTSLKQLYTMTMDVHSRYRTESHQDTVARFNERFILSLGGCETCLVLDDELNVLPLSAGKNVKPLPRAADDSTLLTPPQIELAELKESLKDTQPVGSLVGCAKTLDQARAVLTFIEAIAEKTLRSTVTLTASRGRGKSASLGIAIASAISYGYSNIFITSPSPENIKTLFEFIFKGFDALGYEEHLDYDIIQSTNPAFQKSIVRVNFFRDHRQTIQWIQPSDFGILAQAELLVIDEAAAIPLPVVKKLLGPYLVFMASTINGYEGTGRSLSLKLIQQLREQSRGFDGNKAEKSNSIIVGRDGKEKSSGVDSAAVTTNGSTSHAFGSAAASSRSLREIKLEEPIRYNIKDPVESWLNKLLCLDCCTPASSKSRIASGCPHPSKCELYYVNRDTLFSYHPVSEAFLQMMMSLYVASHYKNSPNDLQLLSDAPAHHLFVLLPPIDERNVNVLPEPLCVVQVCMEGTIAKGSALASLSRGVRASGDLIPWVVTQQFQDDDFASLSGARIVRIATHPDYTGMGYGARAVEQMEAYYSGKIQSLSEVQTVVKEEFTRVSDQELSNASLKTDAVSIRDPAKMPPLLLKLSERPPREHLHWLGVSYGITSSLHKFWKRAGFAPVYMRQTSNDLTGEHTCIMLKQVHRSGGQVQIGSNTWLKEFSWDFRRRFLELLAFQFRTFLPQMVLSIIDATGVKLSPGMSSTDTDDVDHHDTTRKLFSDNRINSAEQVHRRYTPFDLKRLDSYTQNLLDYHVIIDLIPQLSRGYFMQDMSGWKSLSDGGMGNEVKPPALSAVQASIFIGIGMQKKTVEELEVELGLPVSQILALFGKAVKKFSIYLNGLVEMGVTQDVNSKIDNSKVFKSDMNGSNSEARDMLDDEAWDPIKMTLDEDLDEAGNEAMSQFKEKQREMINSLNLSRFEIGGDDQDWQDLTINGGSNIVNIKNDKSTKKRKMTDGEEIAKTLLDKARGISGKSGISSGINDPKDLMGRIRAKQAKIKAKRDKKQLQ